MSDLIKTGKVRFSFCNVFTPRTIDEGASKYSVTMLIQKSDVETLQRIKNGMTKTLQEATQSLFGGTVPAVPKIPLYDGDGLRPCGEPFGDECKGCYVITAGSIQKPEIVDKDLQEIMSASEFYSGCYGRATIRFFAYNKNGNKGVGCGLGNIQKLEDGQPLGSRTNAKDDFSDSTPKANSQQAVDPITGKAILNNIYGVI